jgi:HlyD family secretion protein
VTRYTVTISVPGIDKVKTAMSATATIVLHEQEDALLIPVDAVSTVDGEKCVSVWKDGQEQVVPVTLGLVNNTVAEVLEGLSEGDEVLVDSKSDLEKMMDVMKQSQEAVRGGDN